MDRSLFFQIFRLRPDPPNVVPRWQHPVTGAAILPATGTFLSQLQNAGGDTPRSTLSTGMRFNKRTETKCLEGGAETVSVGRMSPVSVLCDR